MGAEIQMYWQTWNWEKCRDKILPLSGRLGFLDSSGLKFLKLRLSLEDGQIFDELSEKAAPEAEANVYCILSGYADADASYETCKLVTFAQFPGGRNYENAFNRRAVQHWSDFSVLLRRRCSKRRKCSTQPRWIAETMP